MEQRLKAFERYLRSISISVTNIQTASFSGQLPLFVSAPYVFYTASVLNRDYVLAIFQNEELPTPELITLQKNAIEALSSLPCLFLFKTATKEMCRILISKNVCFVIPNKQCFLPGSIVSICEDKFTLPQTKKRVKFSPLAQMVFIFCLLRKGGNGIISFHDLISTLKLIFRRLK